jgi:hypothetical protein
LTLTPPFFSMKITGHNLQTVRFIDSLNFLLCALSKLPKTFGLPEDLRKSYFPYFWNCAENLDVKLDKLPPPKYYGIHSKPPAEVDAFKKWYRQNRNQPFCLRDALPGKPICVPPKKHAFLRLL